MAILKAAEVRSMAHQDRLLRLDELRQELMHERGVAAMGGSPPSPGKIRQLRTAIARIHTINRLESLERVQFTKKEEATGAASEARRTSATRPAPVPARKAPAAQPARAPSKSKTAAKTAVKKTATKQSPTKKAIGGKTGGHE